MGCYVLVNDFFLDLRGAWNPLFFEFGKSLSKAIIIIIITG